MRHSHPQISRNRHLACWLAWQQEPGRPYGTAIKNHYFRPERPLGISFVAWVKLLCGIPYCSNGTRIAMWKSALLILLVLTFSTLLGALQGSIEQTKPAAAPIDFTHYRSSI